MLENLIIPNKLKKGDTIAIVASSWGGPASFPDKFNYGVKILEQKFGLNVKVMPFATASSEDVYNNPAKRAEDLMSAFKDTDVKAIISAIGGDDSIRMLPYIDFDVIKQNPKIYLGYSDSTITHFLCLKAGLRSYYGPSVMAGFAENYQLIPFMQNSIEKSLFNNDVIGVIEKNTDGFVIKQHNWGKNELLDIKRELKSTPDIELLNGDSNVKGRLIGGCMEVLEFLKDTSLWNKKYFKDAILFIETSEDQPSDSFVKWWLRNYAASGILSNLSGIIVGRPQSEDLEYIEKQKQAIIQVVKNEENLNIPILYNLDFGHTDPQMIVPYGAMAKINVEDKTLEILESAVR